MTIEKDLAQPADRDLVCADDIRLVHNPLQNSLKQLDYQRREVQILSIINMSVKFQRL